TCAAWGWPYDALIRGERRAGGRRAGGHLGIETAHGIIVIAGEGMPGRWPRAENGIKDGGQIVQAWARARAWVRGETQGLANLVHRDQLEVEIRRRWRG